MTTMIYHQTDRTARRRKLLAVSFIRAHAHTGHLELLGQFTDPAASPRTLAQHAAAQLTRAHRLPAHVVPGYWATKPGWELAFTAADSDGDRYLAVVHPTSRSLDVLDVVRTALTDHHRADQDRPGTAQRN
ncbi:hypothetical protein [Rhodococcus daqingensis]|uniref:Uncharacterized protein n=1 Tax=Rhodococcus daqingensis TaxID=2479363 RepID=A0ABW2S4G2_9NOCA